MTIYLTKYALTQGIIELEAEVNENGMAMVQGAYTQWYAKADYRLTWAEAFARAHELRLRKIESLKRQINFLEGLSFVGDGGE